MNTSGLSLDQAPPFSAVLRFFLIAPLFGAVAGALIAFNGSTLLLDRFQPTSYALTHIITIGLMGFIMIGALFQMLPVVAGVRLPFVKWFSFIVFAALLIGVFALCYGFLYGAPIGFALGGSLAFLSIIPFAGVAIYKLYKVENPSSTIWLVRLALIGLVITVLLGARLSLDRGSENATEMTLTLSNVHLSWGFIIWTTLLIMGVSRQVLPAFYVTPQYPNICCKLAVPILYFSVIAVSFFAILSIDSAIVVLIAKICAVATTLSFGVLTLSRIAKRKRKINDVSLRYWRFSSCCLIASSPLIFVDYEWAEALLIVLFLGGFVLSLINAMIYKIIPFLSWFHLSAITMNNIPLMSDFISQKAAVIQMTLHIAAIIALVGGVFYDPLFRLGGLFWAIGYLLIFKDVTLSAIIYYRARRKLGEDAIKIPS